MRPPLLLLLLHPLYACIDSLHSCHKGMYHRLDLYQLCSESLLQVANSLGNPPPAFLHALIQLFTSLSFFF